MFSRWKDSHRCYCFFVGYVFCILCERRHGGKGWEGWKKTQSCSMTRIHDCNPEDISSTVLHSNLENLILAELLVFELEFFRGNGNLSSSSRAMDGGEEEKDSPVSPRHWKKKYTARRLWRWWCLWTVGQQVLVASALVAAGFFQTQALEVNSHPLVMSTWLAAYWDCL